MSVCTQLDYQYMARAIRLAEQGLYTTSPNPRVGCVIVNEDKVVGEGFHIKAGGPHAERHALVDAGELAKGACVYVTLEPCSHTGRTSPCADALIAAGVTRVVVGMVDPNPKVSGRGIEKLRQAGIQVVENCLTDACEKLNPGFIKRMQLGKPYVRLKLAASLDGRTAMQSGESQWITSADARRDVQTYRARSCAIISGAGTVLADNPSLNVRISDLNFEYLGEVRQPVRVVIDNQLRLSNELKLFSLPSPVYLVANKKRSGDWPPHVEMLELSQTGQHIDLEECLVELAKREINEVWVEGGAALAGAFMQAGLVDELIIYQAPIFMGENTRGLLDMPNITELKQAVRWQFESHTRVGQDLKLILRAL
ncbi:bifunctional diaminohydroxyphosphoribosylaminopyrimidine deaminase/5-amino-6-(5-phosphoribosylamino)uracil reductase RibD [Catenovulum sediminis]|uniref:Riboflavin biosynthesis protein RibD n=1 Tax=Catenovulum sediminis TaxID=1740262 RepID=A0ABV1RH47_9ALTE